MLCELRYESMVSECCPGDGTPLLMYKVFSVRNNLSLIKNNKEVERYGKK